MAEVLAKRAATAAAARPRSPGTGYGYEHTVQPGETLSAIAAAYKVSSRAIIDANNLTKPDFLQAGQVLFIPE
ncbi:MAG: LysM peptidoglycan-binding domain-containing protein [Candidatus Marinimicrobia bacterium]|nr:LysM peptidoglycan-binding domain-containing protein [Candidatus Neomarinimicrobiota bacterium]